MYSCALCLLQTGYFWHLNKTNINVSFRDAFKTNAWMQISHLSATEAKQEYIEIINSHIEKIIQMKISV
jgi:acyl-CoA-binding protein